MEPSVDGKCLEYYRVPFDRHVGRRGRELVVVSHGRKGQPTFPLSGGSLRPASDQTLPTKAPNAPGE